MKLETSESKFPPNNTVGLPRAILVSEQTQSELRNASAAMLRSHFRKVSNHKEDLNSIFESFASCRSFTGAKTAEGEFKSASLSAEFHSRRCAGRCTFSFGRGWAGEIEQCSSKPYLSLQHYLHKKLSCRKLVSLSVVTCPWFCEHFLEARLSLNVNGSSHTEPDTFNSRKFLSSQTRVACAGLFRRK